MVWLARHPSCLESARSLLSKLKDPLPAATEEEELPQVSSLFLFTLLKLAAGQLTFPLHLTEACRRSAHFSCSPY
jgi:hypothetical protein